MEKVGDSTKCKRMRVKRPLRLMRVECKKLICPLHHSQQVLIYMARFRWAAFQLEGLKGCKSADEIRMTIGALPARLDDAYAEILWGIPELHSLQALKILQWLVYSRRPLRPEEIIEVIAADVNNDSNLNLDERLSYFWAVLRMLPNLVTTKLVTNDDGRIEEHVPLTHFSVQEYLVSGRIRDGPVKQYSIQEERANASIAETCSAYLL